MPSKITTEGVGSGMTLHTRRRRQFDTTQPLTEAEGAALAKGFRAIGEAAAPWRWLEREISIAERTLKAIKEGASDDPDLFKPYAGAGWFSEEIVSRSQWIENAKTSGDWELVARFSYELGQLASTIRLKNSSDDDVEAGRRHRGARNDANAKNRLAPDDERKAIVQEIMAERGRGVRDACAVAAAQFAHLGKKSTFKESYYKKTV